MIYRVTIRTTGSMQPGSGGTFWARQTIYCGPELQEARIAYLREVNADYGGSYGNRARETLIEQFASDADEIDDTTEVECTHNWLGGYCDLCGAVQSR